MEKNLLKILILSADKFPPFRVDITDLFGKEMVGRGHKIDWILQSDKPVKKGYATTWENCNVQVGPLIPYKSIISSAYNYLLNLLNDVNLIKKVKKEIYDIIILKDKFLTGVLCVLASKLYNLKFVYWLSFPIPEASIVRSLDGTANYPFLYWIRGHIFHVLLYKFILPNASHIFVQTDEMKKKVFQKGIPEKKMTSLPMAVNLKKIKYFGYDNIGKSDDKVVVYLGALNRFRRIDFILRSFRKVLNRLPNTKLFLVGGSDIKDDEKFLFEESKRLKIENSVIITGRLPQEKALDLVKSADVCLSFIYPSPIFDVGSPTKLLEYMATGKASVANDHPEQKVVIAESGAGICVPCDEEAFAHATIYLLNNPLKAYEMGINGRNYIVKKRSYRILADKCERKLMEIKNWT